MARLHRGILRTLLARIAAGDPPAGSRLPKEVDPAGRRRGHGGGQRRPSAMI